MLSLFVSTKVVIMVIAVMAFVIVVSEDNGAVSGSSLPVEVYIGDAFAAELKYQQLK